MQTCVAIMAIASLAVLSVAFMIAMPIKLAHHSVRSAQSRHPPQEERRAPDQQARRSRAHRRVRALLVRCVRHPVPLPALPPLLSRAPAGARADCDGTHSDPARLARIPAAHTRPRRGRGHGRRERDARGARGESVPRGLHARPAAKSVQRRLGVLRRRGVDVLVTCALPREGKVPCEFSIAGGGRARGGWLRMHVDWMLRPGQSGWQRSRARTIWPRASSGDPEALR